MTKKMALIVACLLVDGPGSAAAQEGSFACSKICWNPASSSAICSSKLATQLELTSYIWAAQHDIIAKGKGIVFSIGLNTPWQDCSNNNGPGRSVSVSGYVRVQSVSGFTVGALKVGDTIEIRGTGVAADQRNVLFFADPSHN
ncbi:MAG: hypothetical protein ACHQAQ_03995 [Hyphomicrobiales bacterium]